MAGGVRDVVVGYPSVDTETMAAIACCASLAADVTFMVDLPEHVALLAGAAGAAGSRPLRICIDVDASLRVGPVHLGVHRSSVHSSEEALRIARLVADTAGVTLVGLMFYEAQVAGVPDSSAAVRAMKKRSLTQLLSRRAQVVADVSGVAELEFVNGGGTGSIASTRRDPSVTEIAAGSGLFTPTLFDSYDDSGLVPAAYFVSPVVRKPSPRRGGYLCRRVRRVRPGVRLAGAHSSASRGAVLFRTGRRRRGADPAEGGCRRVTCRWGSRLVPVRQGGRDV